MKLLSTNKLTLRKKGNLLILSLLLLQISVFIFIIPTIIQLRNAQKASRVSQEVITSIAELTESLLQARGAFRGYLISKDKVLKEEYEINRKKLIEQIETLSRQIRQQKVHSNQVEGAIYKISDLISDQDHLMLEVTTATIDRPVMKIRIIDTKNQTDQILEHFNYFLLNEKKLNDALEKDAMSLSRTGLLLISGLCVVVFASSILILGAFDKRIGERFGILIDNVRFLSEGKELVAEMNEKDEIGQVDRAFHVLSTTLREKIAENETFVYGVSHDLRSPLVNLQGFGDEAVYQLEELQKLIASVPGETPELAKAREIATEKLPKALKFISIATSRISTITSTLLTLSRTGKKPFQWQMVSLSHIINKIVDALHGSIAEKGAEVQIDPLTSVYGDPTALEQIFSNLIENSIKYLDPARQGKVHIGIDWPSTTPERYTFFIKDNGVGIAEEAVNNVFKPFKRYHPYLAEGEGIGLSIVDRLVKKHFGQIWLQSTPGEGTTFYLSLLSMPVDESTRAIKEDCLEAEFYEKKQ